MRLKQQSGSMPKFGDACTFSVTTCGVHSAVTLNYIQSCSQGFDRFVDKHLVSERGRIRIARCFEKVCATASIGASDVHVPVQATPPIPKTTFEL